MKKLFTLIIAIMLCLSLALSFSSCSLFDKGGDTEDAENQNGTENGTVDGGENEKEQGGEKNPDPPAHTHTFADATCTEPKKCSCGETEGAALGHTPENDDNDCSTALNCGVCGEEILAAGEHSPEADDGDCTTPIICSVCGTTTTPAKDNHTGGMATCTHGKLCEICGVEYDTARNPENHASEAATYIFNGNESHRKIHECGILINEAEAHTFVDGKCVCGLMEIIVNFDAGDYEWTTGDQIKIEKTVGYDSDYYTYTASVDESGTLTWTPDKKLYWNGEDEYILAAFYPAVGQDDYRSFELPEDQSTLEKLKSADCMNAVWIGKPTTDPINFQMKHRLSMITIDYDFASEFTNATIDYAQVIPSDPFVMFDAKGGGKMDEPYGVFGSTIDAYHDAVNKTIQAFVIPCTYPVGQLFMKISVNGKELQVKMPETKIFEEGTNYTLMVIINADGAYLVCTDGCTNFTYTDNTDGTHKKVCTECGYEVSEDHTFDAESYDCICGAIIEVVNVNLADLTATYVINDSRWYHFTGSGSYGIKAESGSPRVILNNANITVGEGCAIDVASGSNATIFVQDDNSLSTTAQYSSTTAGGIFVAEGGTVNITSNSTNNTLRVTGNTAAAIGGKYIYAGESYNAGNINISNVTVYAYTNNFYAAAIGAAGVGTCGTINITNAVVYAYGAGDRWTSAPGIGNALSLVALPETIPVVMISGSEIHTFRYNSASDYIGYLGDVDGNVDGSTFATGSINCGEGGSVRSSTIYCYTGLDATTTDKVVTYNAEGTATEN